MYHIIYKKSIQESRFESKTLLAPQKGQDETLNKIYDIYKASKVSSKEKQYLSSDQLFQLEKQTKFQAQRPSATMGKMWSLVQISPTVKISLLALDIYTNNPY